MAGRPDHRPGGERTDAAGGDVAAALAASPRRLTLTYLVAGSLWIVVSDRLLAVVGLDGGGWPLPQTVKGLAYVGVTALLVHWLARRAVRAALLERADRRLQETQRLLQGVLDGLGEAVFVLDARTRHIVDCNRAAVELFGYARDELVGADTRKLHVDDESYARFRAVSEADLDAGSGFHAEYRLRRRDGTIMATENTVTPIDESLGWKHGVVSIVRDVTRRKRAEAALRASESRLQTLIDTIPDLVWLKDVEGVYLTCNPVFERFFGASRDEIVGHTDYDFVARGLADAFRENDRLALAADGPRLNEESLVFAADGYRGTFETIKTPMRDGAGAVIGVLGIARDVTARQRTEEDLRRSRELLAITGRLAGVGGWSYDVTADTVFWTENLKDILGVGAGYAPRREDVFGFPYFAAEDRPGLQEGFRRALEECVPFETERPFRTADGRERIGQLVCRPESRDGGCTRLFGILRDVTDQRALEARFLQAQKMEAVGRLAGGLAHDYNNMLGVILGNAELLLDELPPDAQVREHVAEIRRAGQRSAGLTRQLLAFSRQPADKPVVLDLNEAVGSILRMLGRLLGEDVGLVWEPAPEPVRVTLDPGQLDQVLVNLVVNARDAIGAGGGTITLRARPVAVVPGRPAPLPDLEPGRWVRLDVADDGSGLDAATRERIFEPFFTTKGEGKGTGLGLPTVYGIVTGNGGLVDVESEPGAGSTFRIYLPAAAEAEGGAEAEDAAVLPTTGSETILLVEDEPVLLEVARRLLERLGYTVNAALGPEAALEVARDPERPFDLLMTDVVMPGMNGRELWDEVARLRPEARCLFVSGHTADVFPARLEQDAGTAFLPKPFSIQSLAAALRRVLDS